jgi:hypothetical protein
MQVLLGYLRGLAVVPPAGSREAPTPAGEVLDRYAEYLRAGRGLKPGTVRSYCNHARAFLADREHRCGGLALETLDVAAINDYLLRESSISASTRRRRSRWRCDQCCASCTKRRWKDGHRCQSQGRGTRSSSGGRRCSWSAMDGRSRMSRARSG